MKYGNVDRNNVCNIDTKSIMCIYMTTKVNIDIQMKLKKKSKATSLG